MRNKIFAGILALFFGIFGVHRFYLGQRPLGIFHFILAVVAIFLTALTELPFVLLPALMGFLDAIIFLSMPRADFDLKYNNLSREQYSESYTAPPASYKKQRSAPSTFESYKSSGIQHFRNYQYEEAAEDFELALEINPDDAALHFNLACTFSVLEDAGPAFYHLEQAVALGFHQTDKIHNHDALAFLRAQPSFDEFVENDYQQPPAQLPAPEEEEFILSASNPSTSTASVLDQIVELGKLRDQGILTNEEFAIQKRKLLEREE
jgi:TM2 domain-containing membrane protein YozV